METIVYEGPQQVAYREKNSPQAAGGEVLIKTSHVGICGSDLNIYAGAHPRAEAPLVLGHEFSGTIVEGHSVLPQGTRVTVNPLLKCGTCLPCTTGQSHVCKNLKLIGIDCDGGMGAYVTVPQENVVALPDSVSLAAGALIEPIAVAVHAVRQGGYVPGDGIVIFGAGTIGLCVAQTLRSYGAADVTVVEPNEHRLQKAAELGFTTIHAEKDDIKAEVLNATNGAGADFVFDCAGHPAVLNALTDIVKVRGRIIIIAAYKKPAELNLLQGMFKELSIQFVRVYTDKDFQIAADLLAKHPEFERIITNVLRPEEAERGFQLLTSNMDAVKVMYKFK
ncbi:alcohol dehydrogenase catalytic domain-containing protein [Halobacillus shinanisalinarum]|uniref:Alcohol dehydrogenase catalytic domain-containing protein n=1 Tax=Halobacillus shinanisalinarum TaxID=2932258 RepID=A0ABY4GZA7_9BACI|nr:alcohol dehydrogenase catalytic domain-containing protein [Halobacillus shinanisalinarum]UOQ93361.1 alcohol dehydrogenase catalytic domain-containing protein [Halobacillus shinanisalinarum]